MIVLASCGAYLYALGQAWDYLQQQPGALVLVLTTESMRRVVDLHDPQTPPIFGDAATAAVLAGPDAPGGAARATLQRPVLGARADVLQALQVPLPAPVPSVRTDGQCVFAEAVRTKGRIVGGRGGPGRHHAE